MSRTALSRRALVGAAGAGVAGGYAAASTPAAHGAPPARTLDVTTRLAAERERIPPLVGLVRTAGYAEVGDGGAASYVRRADAPTDPDRAHFRSADGAWWELADGVVSVKALGAKGDYDATTGEGSDDTAAFMAAVRLRRPIYVPATRRAYKTTDTIALGHDGAVLYGDGYLSRITLVSGPDGAGELIGIHGDAPSTPGGPPQRFVQGVRVLGLHLDTSDGRNNNGVGGSFCRDVVMENLYFSNIGRKALTLQYHCHDIACRDIKVFNASTEARSTHPAISVEGLTHGVDLSYYPGGTSSTEDLKGEDISNITFTNLSIDSSGYNYIVVSNAHDVGFSEVRLGAATGAGSHIVFTRTVWGSHVRSVRAGDSGRRFIFFDSQVQDCSVEDFRFGATRGSGADGRAIHCAGPRNRFENGSFEHGNPTPQEAVLITAPDVTLAGLHVSECASTYVVNAPPAGERLTIRGCTIRASRASAFRVRGAGGLVEGNRFFVAGAPFGGRFEGPGSHHCVGNYFEGTGTDRVVVSANAAVVAAMNVFGNGSQMTFQGGSVYASASFGNLGLVGGHANQLPLDGRAIRVDSAGALRIKEMPFTADLDGTVVGTQG